MREEASPWCDPLESKLLLTSVLAAQAAFGQARQAGPQNSDISILAGPVFGSSQITDSTGATVKASGTWSFQGSFAHTIHSYSFADLWFEFESAAILRAALRSGLSTGRSRQTTGS